MLEQAKSSILKDEYSKLTYHEASAESLPFIKDGTINLVVAGQAAHWFEYIKRVFRKGSALAFWGHNDRSGPEETAWIQVTLSKSYVRRLSERHQDSSTSTPMGMMSGFFLALTAHILAH